MPLRWTSRKRAAHHLSVRRQMRRPRVPRCSLIAIFSAITVARSMPCHCAKSATRRMMSASSTANSGVGASPRHSFTASPTSEAIKAKASSTVLLCQPMRSTQSNCFAAMSFICISFSVNLPPNPSLNGDLRYAQSRYRQRSASCPRASEIPQSGTRCRALHP